MTTVGLVTLAGHAVLIVFFYRRPVATGVKQAWAWLFILFCAVTLSHNVQANTNAHFFLYALPALVATIHCARLLPHTPLNICFTSLFVVNITGNWLGADQFKFMTVDVLDVFVWVQMNLLLRIAWLNPANYELGINRPQQKKPMLRVIDGRFGNPSEA